MKRSNLKAVIPVPFTFIILGTSELLPCTVAVVSGKATPDGRPLMWKNRDTSVLDNKIRFFKGKKYNFIGLINAKDNEGKDVWTAINEKGRNKRPHPQFDSHGKIRNIVHSELLSCLSCG